MTAGLVVLRQQTRQTNDDAPSQKCLGYRSPSKYLHHLLDLSIRSLRTIKDAFSAVYTTKCSIDSTETHPAARIPLCHLNSYSGLLFEAIGKLRADSREVRYVFSCTLFASFRLRWSSFLGGKFARTNESILHAALGETENVGIDEDKVELPGNLVGQRSRRAAL